MERSKLLSLFLGIALVTAESAVALPPPEDTPEEILRTEIVTEARSPIDGEPLTAAEYAQLQAELSQRSTPPELAPEIQHNIFLLQLLDFIRTISPL
jgi:hypothetical protein